MKKPNKITRKAVKEARKIAKDIQFKPLTKEDVSKKDWKRLQSIIKKDKTDEWYNKEFAKLNSVSDPLQKRIGEYLKIEGLGDIIIACADNIMRYYMYCESGNEWQKKVAHEDVDFLFKEMNKKGHVNSLVYKAIELGELLKCKELWGTCPYAKDCWVTRRGFCEKKRVQIK